MPAPEQIRCQREQVLMDADSVLDHVFFPDSGVVSVVAVYADGSIIEMATVGRKGCTTVQAILGAKSSSVRLLAQIPGGAARMSRAAFMRAMDAVDDFRFRTRMPSRAAAVRELMKRGLSAEGFSVAASREKSTSFGVLETKAAEPREDEPKPDDRRSRT